MKTKAIALALVLLLTGLVTACNGDSDVTLVAPPTVSLSPSASVIPTSPLASSTPEPTLSPTIPADLPTDTTVPVDPDITLGTTFKELAKESDLVVRGKLIEKLKEPYNLIRDINDPELPDEKEKSLEWQFVMEVTEVYKTPKDTTIKAGDKITVNLAYEDNNYMTGYKTKPVSTYFEPDLNKDLVMFLYQNTLDKKIYYPEVSPFYFEVKEEKLYVKAKSDKVVKEFESKMKLKAGDGAPIANLKKDLGVK